MASEDNTERLSKVVREAVQQVEEDMRSIMTPERCERVRKLRCGVFEHSWRQIAEICAEEWNGNWGDNQIWGMLICKVAAKHFDEDYINEPWGLGE